MLRARPTDAFGPSSDSLGRSSYNLSFNSSKVDSSSNSIARTFPFEDKEADCYACTGLGEPVCEIPKNYSIENSQTGCNQFFSFLLPLSSRVQSPTWGRTRWWFGNVLDPRSKSMRVWARLFLVSTIISISVDPFFLYIRSVHPKLSCLFFIGDLAIIVTVLRSTCDLIFFIHMLLKFRTAYVSEASLVIGQGELVTNAKEIATNYFFTLGGFAFDLFVTLPVPQLGFWVLIPNLMRGKSAINRVPVTTTRASLLIQLTILIQYWPKLFHSFFSFQQWQRVNGYVFGAAWSGFALNLAAYVIAAHVAGAVWYLLGTERVMDCLRQECHRLGDDICKNNYLSCPQLISYGNQPSLDNPWANNSSLSDSCLSETGTGAFNYGIYSIALRVIVNDNYLDKILYGLYFGLMTLSSFGNALVPSAYGTELVYSILVILSGLLLFVLLIGNIQVFLQSIWERRDSMLKRKRNMEWWMNRRQLPSRLKARMRKHEKQTYIATRGVAEEEILSTLPSNLQRDIKRHLCLSLVQQVPLFKLLDEVVLDNICERLKHILFIENSVILREKEPVSHMLFIMRGRLQSIHKIFSGKTSTCSMGVGNFCGEELLTWCLGSRSNPHEPLPLSSSTLITTTTVEAFSLSAEDLSYVTNHFAFYLRSKKLRRWIRYYSPHWRTWAAVTIQLAWRSYKASRGTECKTSSSPSLPSSPSASALPASSRGLSSGGGGDQRDAGKQSDSVTEDSVGERDVEMGEIESCQLAEPSSHETRRSSFGGFACPKGRKKSDVDKDRLRMYAAIITAPKPKE